MFYNNDRANVYANSAIVENISNTLKKWNDGRNYGYDVLKHVTRAGLFLCGKTGNQVKMSVMSEIVRAEFEQNPDLAEELFSTQDAYLEEGNTWGDRQRHPA